ncbi:hypothetical protein [Flagellimonas pacifica]|nr:hypothetical protein [Allomuricauda parva]
MTSKNTKRYMVLSFTFLTIVLSIISLLAILITVYGNYWNPLSNNFAEILWTTKGFIITTIFSAIALIGFIQTKKFGIVFGLTTISIVILGILLAFIFGLNGPINNIVLLVFVVLATIAIFMLWNILQMDETRSLKLNDYLLICFMVFTGLISLPSFFFN